MKNGWLEKKFFPEEKYGDFPFWKKICVDCVLHFCMCVLKTLINAKVSRCWAQEGRKKNEEIIFFLRSPTNLNPFSQVADVFIQSCQKKICFLHSACSAKQSFERKAAGRSKGFALFFCRFPYAFFFRFFLIFARVHESALPTANIVHAPSWWKAENWKINTKELNVPSACICSN